jgi:hypothetical protein
MRPTQPHQPLVVCIDQFFLGRPASNLEALNLLSAV